VRKLKIIVIAICQLVCYNREFFSPSELGLSFESTPVLNSELLLEDSASSSNAATQSSENKEGSGNTMAVVNNGGNTSFTAADDSQMSISRWGETPLG